MPGAGADDNILETDTIAAQRLSTILSRHILPIFETYREKPRLCGSGLLVSCESGSFLISAAHVFDPPKAGGDLFFYVEARTTRKLSGRLALTTFRGKDRSSDRVDVGVLKLEGRGLPPYPRVEISSVHSSIIAGSAAAGKSTISTLGIPWIAEQS